MTVLVEFAVLVRIALVSLVIGVVVGLAFACSVETTPVPPPPATHVTGTAEPAR